MVDVRQDAPALTGAAQEEARLENELFGRGVREFDIPGGGRHDVVRVELADLSVEPELVF